MEKQNKGCGREWTESACVKTEPDYCGEGDNLCPECEEKNQPLSEKGIVIQTGNPADPIDEEVFDYRDVKQKVKEAYSELKLSIAPLGNLAQREILFNRLYKTFENKFGFEL